MLNVRNASSSGRRAAAQIVPKTGGTSHADRSTTAVTPSGRERGTFPVIPPPVMWAIPRIGTFRSRERTGRT